MRSHRYLSDQQVPLTLGSLFILNKKLLTTGKELLRGYSLEICSVTAQPEVLFQLYTDYLCDLEQDASPC
jgi:hypothetical protein